MTETLTREVARTLALFFAPGTPRPKGSLSPVSRRGAKTRLVDSEPSQLWLKQVAAEAFDSVARRSDDDADYRLPAEYPWTGAVELRITFNFERPASVTEDFPITTRQGDLDKLLRNICDALQTAKIIKNDSQVVYVRTEKRWATEGEPVGASVLVLEAKA